MARSALRFFGAETLMPTKKEMEILLLLRKSDEMGEPFTPVSDRFSQAGLADRTRVSQSRISFLLKELMIHGYVECIGVRKTVPSARRKSVKVYALTKLGADTIRKSGRIVSPLTYGNGVINIPVLYIARYP